ncbi:MAG: LysR family transcriptional regulator [Lachnospiraceae bacterium]|nr:LysR family transcriptional regulator [Lachnospiraceae bacterium]
MTLRNMRIFMTVCENGNSITAAANALYLSQPSVTAAVQSLETEIGAPLFERLSRRLYLTERGKTFLSYAQRILSLYGEMQKTLTGEQELPLRVGASLTIGSTILPGICSAYLAENPARKLTVQVRRSRILQEMLHTNELDLALLELPIDDPLLLERPFGESALEVIAPLSFSKDAITKEELLSSPLILREKGSGTRDYFDRVLEAAGLSAVPVWESESPEAILEMVSDGMGLGVLPRGRILHDLEAGRVKRLRLQDLSFPLEFTLVLHRDKIITDRIREFADMLTGRSWTEGGEVVQNNGKGKA